MNCSSLFIKDTEVGKGVFTNKDFKIGETVFEFQGGLFTSEELPNPYSEVEGHYVQIDKNLYMGPSGGMDDFFNHSCDPNTGLKIIDNMVFLIVIKKIKTDDQITWDYSTTMDEDNWTMNYNCGYKNCRKIIRDFKYPPINIQKKYLKLKIIPKYILDNIKK